MWPRSAWPMLTWARLRRTMAENVSMMGMPAGQHGRDAERVAEQERSGIPEEYARRVEVVAQEAERRAGERDGKRRGVRPAGHDGEYEHREARDAGEPGGEPVEPVDEVEDVHVRDEVDDGDGVGPDAKVERALRRGVHDDADDDAGRDGEKRGDDLSEELLQGLELEHVVQDAREEYGGKPADQKLVVHVLEEGRRHEHHGPAEEPGAEVLHDKRRDDAGEDRDAAHARNGARVDPALVWIVDGAEPPGDAPRERGRDQCREQRCDEEAEVWQPRPIHAPSSRLGTARNNS